jgi:hypothetical protein
MHEHNPHAPTFKIQSSCSNKKKTHLHQSISQLTHLPEDVHKAVQNHHCMSNCRRLVHSAWHSAYRLTETVPAKHHKQNMTDLRNIRRILLLFFLNFLATM